MVCTADEMMAGRGEEEEEEGGVHVQGGQYFGTGSYVSTSRTPACFDPDIIYSMLRCVLLSPQRRRQLCLCSELACFRPFNAGDIT